MWGHSHLLGTGARGTVNHLKRTVADRLLGYRRVDAYRLNPAICAQYAEALIAFRPLAFISYASALDLFARYTLPLPRSVSRARVALRARDRRAAAAARHDRRGWRICSAVRWSRNTAAPSLARWHSSAGREPFEVYHDLNYLECTAAGAGG